MKKTDDQKTQDRVKSLRQSFDKELESLKKSIAFDLLKSKYKAWRIDGWSHQQIKNVFDLAGISDLVEDSFNWWEKNFEDKLSVEQKTKMIINIEEQNKECELD